VLVLGLSYKADIDDDRESPSYEIIELLREAGAEVAYCDPYIPVARPGRKHDIGLARSPARPRSSPATTSSSSPPRTPTSPGRRDAGTARGPPRAEGAPRGGAAGGFFSYAAGVAYQVLTNYRVRGLVVRNFRTDLPIKKGLSSSAAISVLTARAFNRVYDLRLTVRGEMELAYQGEITTPSRCGRMDQGCAFGDRAVLMEFDGDRLSTEEIRPAKELHFVIVDLKAKKDTVEILGRLNRSYPFADGEVERGVQELLGPVNKRIVHQAKEALARGDARAARGVDGRGPGALRPLRRSRLPRGAPRAGAAPRPRPRRAAAPRVGRQGRGLAGRRLGPARGAQRGRPAAAIEILERDLALAGLPLTLGTGPKVTRALIPAAGFGTRLFPASKATKKELFPVIDRDGIAKPAILLIVEEALEAGIEEVVIVVQEDDLEDFRSFFTQQISIENFNKLPRAFQDYARRILEIGRRVVFVTQSAQEGFGHAVFSARGALGEEPFLLMLGDHLYRSTTDVSCARQLVEAYQRSGTSVVGLRRTLEGEIGAFGAATGVWLEPERLLNITEFAEKPTVDYARTSLRVPAFPTGSTSPCSGST
jgi:UTP-glucose-1-phosphate uridylyltransferase